MCYSSYSSYSVATALLQHRYSSYSSYSSYSRYSTTTAASVKHLHRSSVHVYRSHPQHNHTHYPTISYR